MSSILPALVIHLLCIYFHVCNARVLGVVRKEMIANEFHQNSTRVSTQAIEKPSVHSNAMANKSKTSMLGDHKPEKGHEFSGARPETPETKVSWMVPEKKKKRGGEPESGYNLDYLPPKTHPPVHN